MTRKRAILAGIVALEVLAALVAVDAVFCRATLHVHRRLGPRPPQAVTVSIRAADQARLDAWWLQPSTPNGNCVLVLHGIADSRVGSAGFAPMFLNAGYGVLVPDSRAHGTSGGDIVTYGLLEKRDVLGWAVWLRQQGCRKLYGLGESLGASILIQAAETQPAFSAIAAECPYADLREVAEYRVRQQTGVPAIAAHALIASAVFYAKLVDGIDLGQVSPVRSIARVSTPILLIHGLADLRTPPYNSEKMARANSGVCLWLVPGAPHVGASRVAPGEFRKRVLAWFAEH